MKDIERIMKLLSDPTRLRILMLLARRELCVCQIMGVLGVSQPLVSRNLNLMNDAGLLAERREGKLIFYSLSRPLPSPAKRIVGALREELREDPMIGEDLDTLKDCEEFQKKTGKCDMKTLGDFMSKRRKRSATE